MLKSNTKRRTYSWSSYLKTSSNEIHLKCHVRKTYKIKKMQHTHIFWWWMKSFNTFFDLFLKSSFKNQEQINLNYLLLHGHIIFLYAVKLEWNVFLKWKFNVMCKLNGLFRNVICLVTITVNTFWAELNYPPFGTLK